MKKSMVLSVLGSVLVLTACGSNNNDEEASGAQTNNNEANNSGESAEGNSSSEEISLRLTTGLSPTDANTAAFTHPWMEMVEERTDGQVTFDAFFSEELVPMGEEIPALEDGTVDLAAPILPTYEPARYPLSDVVLLPLESSDAQISAMAFAELIKSEEELQDGQTFTEMEYGTHGMKALPVQPVPEYTIGVIDHEFSDVESLQNLQLRTSGRAHEILVDELGSSSVSMPFSEEFEAMSRGAIEGTVRAISDYEPYGFDEMITNALEGVSLGHFPFVWLMSEERWNELPTDVQEVMEEAAYELAESTTKLEAMEAAYENAEEQGIEFTDVADMEPEAQEHIEQAVLNTWEKWIAAKEEEGLPGKEAAILWRDLIVEQGGTVHESIMELE